MVILAFGAVNHIFDFILRWRWNSRRLYRGRKIMYAGGISMKLTIFVEKSIMESRVLIVCCSLCLALMLASCKSNERKAEEFIRTELSKTLLDFNSYEPIETTVVEAYENAYNDSWCFQQALTISQCMKNVEDYKEAMSDAREHMDIWGAPSYYSSSYSDNQFYKYKAQVEENLSKLKTELALIRVLGIALQDSIKCLDTVKMIGWEVKHRFRCKTRGGQSAIADYRYIFDKKFENVILREDMDDDDYSEAMEWLEFAGTNGFDEI